MKHILYYIVFCFTQIAFAQSPPHIQDAKRCNNWGFGYASFVNVPFNGQTKLNVPSTAQKRLDSYVDFNETNTHISDTLGNLMFYSNGVMIADSTHHVMLGCDTLNPGYYASQSVYGGYRIGQGVLALPFPNNPDVYYLFHTRIPNNTAYSLVEGIYYTIVDMKRNNGLGAVVSLRNPIITNSVFSPRINACRHANGRDWWVIIRALDTDAYATILFSPQGVSAPVWHNAMLPPQSYYALPSFYSQSCFSPDGTKFVYHAALGDFGNYITLYDFDRCEGIMSNPRLGMVSDSTGDAGVSFSPNSKYLYFNTAIQIFQIDATNPNPFNHIDTVVTLDNFINPDGFRNYFSRQQLGDDNKIYIRCIGSNKYMHTINNPDLQGVYCDVRQHSIILLRRNGFSLPLSPYFGLGPIDGSVCDSLGINNVVSTENQINQGKEDYIKVFPNPTNGTTRLIWTEPLKENALIEISNSIGQLVQTISIGIGATQQDIDIKAQPNGIYFVSLRSKTAFSSVKLVKIE